MAMSFLFFILGLVVLVVGAELLVRGASRLALAMGISPVIIGLTIVAFGTSAPEMAVSVQAGLLNQADIALGNVIGSNIFNVLFILGLSALIAPLIVNQRLIAIDVPIMIGLSLLALLFALDGVIGRLEGGLMFLGLIAYTVYLYLESRNEPQPEAIEAEYAQEFGAKGQKSNPIINIVLVIAGLGLLILGSRWMVTAAIEIATAFGISEIIIGLTIVAAGTSMPEVATSIIASLRGERDIAVGNVVGSNIFNLLGVLGLAAAVSPVGVLVNPEVLAVDIPIMLAVTFACLPVFFHSGGISRWEGGLFFFYYLAYTGYLILNATSNPLLPNFNTAMLTFVLPITLITLIVITVQGARKTTPSATPTDNN